MQQLAWFVSASSCDEGVQRARPTAWTKQPEFKTYPPHLPVLALPSLQACVDAEPHATSRRLIAALSEQQQHNARERCSASNVEQLPLERVSLLSQLSFGVTGDVTYKLPTIPVGIIH
jgi:hypothetical protein